MARLSSFLLWVSLMLAAAPMEARTRVELITVGPGDEIYTRFGHTALLVSRDSVALGVYNYGLSDFDRPGLIHDFLRGEPIFWVAYQYLAPMVDDYRAEDRAVLRQPLDLSPQQTRQLMRLLARDALPANKEYAYHHFFENCATRPRDRINEATGGAVARQLKGQPTGYTWRHLIRQGFAGRTGILVATELLVGRRVDRPVDRWDALFLPANMSRYLQQVKLPGGALVPPPLVILPRKGANPLAADALAGVKLLWALAALSCLLAPVMILLARRRSRWAALPLLLQALPLGTCAVLCWALFLGSTVPELWQTELVAVLWPTDLLLLMFAVAWLRGRWPWRSLLKIYATVRLGAVAVALAGHATGLLYQEPRAALIMAAALAVGLWGTTYFRQKEELTANG